MTKSQKDLLLLLRAALWNDTEAAQRIHDANWEEIALLAKEQTVIGICGDAIAMLDKEQCPGTELKTKWAGWMLQTERHNERMNHAAAAITHGFKKYGLTPILMKGQALASYYPAPEHRQCGDIDICFLNNSECDTAREIAKAIVPKAEKTESNKRERKHFSFNINGIEVELHHFLCLLETPKLNRRLQDIIDKELHQEPALHINIGDYSIRTLPPTLSVLHQIIHITTHLLEAGIGLRQFCDIAMFLEHNHDKTDSRQLQLYLQELELASMAANIGYILHNIFGMDKTKIPFSTNGKDTRFIMNEVFEGGNFGKKRIEKSLQRKGNVVFRKISSMIYFAKRCYRYRVLLPQESKHYLWFKIILNYRLFRKKPLIAHPEGEN